MTGKVSRKQLRWYQGRVVLASLVAFVAIGAALLAGVFGAGDDVVIPDEVTWSRDIAPIITSECLDCHGESPSAPFQLLSYEDAAERADIIARVTSSRRMPPWLPGDGHGTFEGERILTDREVQLFTAWWKNGALHGTASLDRLVSDLEPEWDPGDPDLTLTLPSYDLPAEGRDVYRNLVIEIPVEEAPVSYTHLTLPTIYSV